MKFYTIRIWDNNKMDFYNIESPGLPFWMSSAKTNRTVSMLPTNIIDCNRDLLFEGDFILVKNHNDEFCPDDVRLIEYDFDENKFVLQGWCKNSDPLEEYACRSQDVKRIGNLYENANDAHIWYWMRWETDEQIKARKEYSDKKDAKILKYINRLIRGQRLKRKNKSEILKWIRWKMPSKWRSKRLFIETMLSPGLSSIFDEDFQRYQNGYEDDGLEPPGLYGEWKNIFNSKGLLEGK